MKKTINELEEFWKKERDRAKYIIEKVHQKKWDLLPPEYQQDPETTIKHFLKEIKLADEKIQELKEKECNLIKN